MYTTFCEKTIALVRVPYLSRYNQLDVREEPIISSAAGLLHHLDIDFTVFDFHLDRDLVVSDLLSFDANLFILGVRGTGLHWKYAHLIALHLLKNTGAHILIYGQTGKLKSWSNPDPTRVVVLPHDENALAGFLGVAPDAFSFESGLRHFPYALDIFPKLGDRRKLFKATFETTRGCHFGCKFCFINHGTNYPVRYARRSVDDVMADMQAYIDLGITNFWFYDSEFIGGDKKQYPDIKNLLKRLVLLRETIDFEIMLYCRSDTLRRFDEFQLLHDAGVKTVLMGIESLDVIDLKVMRKAQDVTVAEDTIRKLRDNSIFCNLSFILFNRSATINSIIGNLERVIALYNERNFVYLGQLQYFSYAFESDWSPSKMTNRVLSEKTKLSSSTRSTDSGATSVTFNPELEPLAEIYRVINYEQIRKTCDLVMWQNKLEGDEKRIVHNWATNLSLFILNLMYISAVSFKSGSLTLNTVHEYEKWVYSEYSKFYALHLPCGKQDTITDTQGYWKGDWNGWESQIPSL